MREISLPSSLQEAALLDLSSAISTPDTLILRGGASVFCRGMAFEAAPSFDMLSRFAEVLLSLRSRVAPTLAVVEGDALGGGLGLAVACDLIVASSSARFGLPEVLFGLTPAMIAPLVRERISSHSFRKMALTGESIDAREAARIGLVDEVSPSLDLRRALRLLSRAEPAARARLKAPPQCLVDEVFAGCQTTASLLRSPASMERRARFVEGHSPWEAQ